MSLDTEVSVYAKCCNVYKRRNRKPEPPKADLDFLVNTTNFPEVIIKKWYLQFIEEFPNEVIEKEDMLNKLSSILPMDTAPNTVDLILTEYDLDRDDKIDFTEFILASHRVKTAAPTQKLRWIFHQFDTDQSGTLVLGEVVQLTATLYINEGLDTDAGLERALRIYHMLDRDDNGEVTEEEFIDICLADDDLVLDLFQDFRADTN